jgi:hypothetical protein
MRSAQGGPPMTVKPIEQRLIAFYLPQFYPFPENDRWWGKGFTEWMNVTRARPLFHGHYQPHLPAYLGFYDLRLPEARSAQADLAKAFGLHGFCYYHYWFEGRRLLDRPFQEVLRSGEPDFPFCLCWANESWSRRWLGEEKDLLVQQTYSFEDDVNHARYLVNAFADPRYIKVSGKPLFLIYRPNDLPEARQTIDVIRNQCLRHGLPDPYLVGVDGHAFGRDFRQEGFDCTLAFEPQLAVLPDALRDGPTLSKLARNSRRGVLSPTLKIFDDLEARTLMRQRQRDFPFIRSVFVAWDNSPRRGEHGVIIEHSTPDAFHSALSVAMQSQAATMGSELPVFINAWNEWAEGNHLEPDQRFGCEYLTKIQALTNVRLPVTITQSL